MKHRETLCVTPRKYFQQPGMLWQCDCGKMYRFTKTYGMKGGGVHRRWKEVTQLAGEFVTH
jgi:hypothetical protein